MQLSSELTRAQATIERAETELEKLRRDNAALARELDEAREELRRKDAMPPEEPAVAPVTGRGRKKQPGSRPR